jgi:hypothetical protein
LTFGAGTTGCGCQLRSRGWERRRRPSP